MKLDSNLIRTSVSEALREDVGTGDITTQATISPSLRASGKFVAKQDGVICGLQIAAAAFEIIDPTTVFEPLCKDGDRVKKGDVIARVSGAAQSLLTAERVALNFLQRLSGIAGYCPPGQEMVFSFPAQGTGG